MTHVPLSADIFSFRHWGRALLVFWKLAFARLEADSFAWAPPPPLPRGVRAGSTCVPRVCTTSDHRDRLTQLPDWQFCQNWRRHQYNRGGLVFKASRLLYHSTAGSKAF